MYVCRYVNLNSSLICFQTCHPSAYYLSSLQPWLFGHSLASLVTSSQSCLNVVNIKLLSVFFIFCVIVF